MSLQESDWTPRSLPLLAWIERGGVFEAKLDAEHLVDTMPRLYSLSLHPPREALRWRACGLSDLDAAERRHWLRLEAFAQLILTCQRCMHPLS
ncbi:MAG: hypothetical protein ACK5DS_14455, partial [Burkholderiales bacterium]